MQDSDSFICSYESDQCTRGEDEGVFSLKKHWPKKSGCIFDGFHCTTAHHPESEPRV